MESGTVVRVSDPSGREAGESGAADGDRFTDRLRATSGPTWREATEHRFTRELGTDSLPDDVFARYLVQDYAFVETLASTVGFAVAQAPTMTAKARLADFLSVLTSDEDEYFRRSFRALNVPESEWSDPTRDPVTERFEDLLIRAAGCGGYAETLAVVVPVEWIYLAWADGISGRPERFYLAEWLDLHRGPAFEGTVEWLRRELDREGPTLSPRRRSRVETLFRRAVEHEVAFFDAAYADRPSRP